MESLHVLRGNCKKDPEAYYDEFQNQYVRYKSFLETVRAQPGSASEDFRVLIEFISYLSDKFKSLTVDFAKDLIGLLETYNEQLEGSTRKALVKALIIIKRKKQVESMEILPLFFKLFNVRDKELRKILQSFIVTDVKSSSGKGGERQLQGFLFKQVDEGGCERVAKRGLSVVIELWRTYAWRNARTVSVIAQAVQNPSHSIMLAALKFFLGQDERVGQEDEEEESDLEADANKAVSEQICRSNFYNVKKRGSSASRKKKKVKIERAVNSIKKAVRKEKENQVESFAAIQLIHDPQEFAEKLFARLNRERSIKFDTKIAMIKIQKYLNPSQKDVTQVLAALVQACHDVIPPDILQPVMRQLVDSFVHDRARPEVMTIGLKTVRQICERCPLIMNQDLLQDLTQYQKFKNKEVTAAARSLVALFRQLAPSMLSRKDRGRAANLDIIPAEYGQFTSKTRVEGADLLQRAVQQGLLDGDGNIEGELESDNGDCDQEDEGEISEEENASTDDEDENVSNADQTETGDQPNSNTTSEIEEDEAETKLPIAKKQKKEADPDSLASLRKDFLLACKKRGREEKEDDDGGIVIEQTKFISQDEFDAIKELRRAQLVRQALRKHGVMSVSKKRKLEEEAEAYADAVMALEKRRATIGEFVVDANDLKGVHRSKASKEERVESIMKGRKDRPEYGKRESRKTKSSASLSNKEKEKKKLLPLGAKKNQIKRRQVKKAKKGAKNFKGHVNKKRGR